ncbi:acetyltransferase [Brevundimonas sp.]|uniref:acetyltransferase n=1 Tax=Brevundimonas sp. TaxID=1871086 RepID=UPI002D3ACC93|nr:acetyltransferase [Brevundimonas sp.]HYC66633.1 acetyltransferase [Brevundimonas sp.]
MTVAIYGSGGFGRELLPFAGPEPLFVSDDPAEIGTSVEGVRVVRLQDVGDRPIVIAIADGQIRRRLAARLQNTGQLISPTAIIGPGVEIGEGAILCAFTTVTASARIGRHFHANIYSYVAHDCVVGDFVTVGPRVGINGNTIVEDDVYIGTGAVLRHGTRDRPLRIGKGAVVGMGAVVTRDVPPGTTVVGNPARPMVHPPAALRAV